MQKIIIFKSIYTAQEITMILSHSDKPNANVSNNVHYKYILISIITSSAPRREK